MLKMIIIPIRKVKNINKGINFIKINKKIKLNNHLSILITIIIIIIIITIIISNN